DSSRSPAWPKIDKTTATTASHPRPDKPENEARRAAAPIAPSTPPTAPDQVLLGLIAGASFGPCSTLPTKNATISVVHTTAKRKMIAWKPYRGSDRNTTG